MGTSSLILRKAIGGALCAVAIPVADAFSPAAGYVAAGACAALGLTATTQYLSLRAAGDLMVKLGVGVLMLLPFRLLMGRTATPAASMAD